jgi:hypothetical protein
MTPPTFVPGGHGTFTMTVHNAGPDAAGTTSFGNIRVYGNGFTVTTNPPPFELAIWPIEGDCSIERAVTEPLPDGNIGLVFIYYFGVIPAGESRSCSGGIDFYPSTRANFSTSWLVDGFPNNHDTNPANDRVDYVFRVRPTTIPALSPVGLVALALGLLAAGLMRCRA